MVEMFKKNKDGIPQKELTAKQREQATRELYSYIPCKLKKTQNVLIVDDIITTGSTVEACASLIKNRVKNVYVCAIARNKLRK